MSIFLKMRRKCDNFKNEKAMLQMMIFGFWTIDFVKVF